MGHPNVHEGACLVVLNGDLDVYRAGEIRTMLEMGVGNPRMIIDLSQATTVSAMVLGELIHNHKQRCARGLEAARIVLRSPLVRKLFDITHLTGLWPFFDTVCAASVP